MEKFKTIIWEKISNLLTKKKIQENINTDLLKRVKLLEYELNRVKENKKSKNNKTEIIFKDSQYINLIKDDIMPYIDNFNSTSKSSFNNILKNLGISERFANNLFLYFELKKPVLKLWLKKILNKNFYILII